MGMAVLGVIVLVFIGLAILSAKTWQIWHVLLMFGLFASTLCFMIFAAATLKTQERWRSQYKTLTADMERAQEEHQRLLRSVSTEEDGSPTSLMPLTGELRRTLVDRGRVWRNLGVADIGQGTITLDAANWGDDSCYSIGGGEFDDFEDDFEDEPEDGAAAPDPVAAGKPLGLAQGAIVFAFVETPIANLSPDLQKLLYGDGEDTLAQRDQQSFCKVPAFFVGEFRITSDPQADPASLTLVPNLALTDAQIEQLNVGDSWVLYEALPVDSHDALQGMTAEQVQLWLPTMIDDDERYQAIVDEYVRDQTQANEMDPPERKWMQVKFNEPKQGVDVDVNEPISLPDTPFDPSGRANADDLRQAAAVDFDRNDEVLLDFATAEQYINEGVVDPGTPIYVRQLRDYERFFRANAGQIETSDRQIKVATEDLAKLNQSIQDLSKQIVFATNRRDRLTEDRDGFNMELAVITQYKQALEKEWKSVLSDLSRLYRANKQQMREADGVTSANTSTQKRPL